MYCRWYIILKRHGASELSCHSTDISSQNCSELSGHFTSNVSRNVHGAMYFASCENFPHVRFRYEIRLVKTARFGEQLLMKDNSPQNEHSGISFSTHVDVNLYDFLASNVQSALFP